MNEPIAIVGSACRFAGGASSPSKLWELLRNPRDVRGDFTQEQSKNNDRLNLSSFYHPNGEQHGATDVAGKSYLLEEDIRLFDAAFFNIAPHEAAGIDPQQRLLLETVYEAFESAGYGLQQIQGSQTCVYSGVMTADYYDLQLRDPETLPRYSVTGTTYSFVSNRISYFFDLKGASMTINTACSSSLVALHEAIQSMRNGHSTAAVVTGSNIILDSPMYIGESGLHMLSPDSRSRMWDSSANGYARGEGIAAIYLKPLKIALADGDHIECIIRETGVNSDGRTKGITMPSAEAQAALIRQTYRNAGLDPVKDRPQFFECHGTGTLAGDPVEAQAICDAFFPNANDAQEKIRVGSIKSVIGHSEGAAGLAAILKVSLALQNRTMLPNMHFVELNPRIEPFYRHLEIVTSPQEWPQTACSACRASVNNFGLGGTNAHAILERYEPQSSEVSSKPTDEDEVVVGPLPLSAKTNTALVNIVNQLADLIESTPELNLRDLAYTFQERRGEYAQKAFFSESNRHRLIDFMRQYVAPAAEGQNDKVAPSEYPDEEPGVLGIFTGQGAQWARMSSALIESCSLFRQSLQRYEASLAALPESDAPRWSIIEELFKESSTSRLSEAAISQPLCTAVQIAMVDLFQASGIRLDAVVGHSSGEIAAAYAAGFLAAEDAIRVAYYRGFHARLAQGRAGEKGAMMAVGISFDEAASFCAQEQFVDRIGIAASNSPSLVTLSGDVEAISEAQAAFEERKIFARRLAVDTAYHSHHMLPCADAYLESLKACNIQIQSGRSDCTWISSVFGDFDRIMGDDRRDILTGPYWVQNMVQPVLFSYAVEESLWRSGPFDVMVELGPHPALKGPTTQTVKAVTGAAVPYCNLMRRNDNDVEAFSGGIGYVWSHLGSSRVD